MITIFFCNCLFVSASLRAKLIFFVGSNTRMYHAILKSKISCGISETWQFGQMSQREWDWGADKDPSVWHKYKAKTWALDLMLRCIPYPLISPLFANTKEVLLGQDISSAIWYPKLLLAQLILILHRFCQKYAINIFQWKTRFNTCQFQGMLLYVLKNSLYHLKSTT